MCSIKWIAVRPQINCWLRRESYKVYRPRFMPNMAYSSISPEKVIFSNTNGSEIKHYFKYLCNTNKYKPYFYTFSDEIIEGGKKIGELPLFLNDLVTTLHNTDEDSIKSMPLKNGNLYHTIHLSKSTKIRLSSRGKVWLYSLKQSTNQTFLKDLQFVALLWCFDMPGFQHTVAARIYYELMQRYSSMDTQSCLKTAFFLLIFKYNNSIQFFKLRHLWYLMVKKLYKDVDNISDEETLLTIFLCGLVRNEELRFIMRKLTLRFRKSMPYLSPNEVGALAISNFLTTSTKFGSPMTSVFLDYFILNIDHVNDICFGSLCKYLKFSKSKLIEYELEHIDRFLKSFHDVMTSFGPMSLAIKQGYLFLLTHGIFTQELLQFLGDFLLKTDLTQFRSKELSYYAGIIGRMFPLLPESHEILSRLSNELCKDNRIVDIETYTYQIPLALDCASRAGFYPPELIRKLSGKSGAQDFEDKVLNQYKFVMGRLEIDEPALSKTLPEFPQDLREPGMQTMSNGKLHFIEKFKDFSTKEFGCKVVRLVYNFHSNSQELELRISNGELVPVDQWHRLDRCVKLVIIYTLPYEHHYVIDGSFNIYHELDSLLTCNLRIYEKMGYKFIVTRGDKKKTVLPKYFKKLIDDIKDVCSKCKNNEKDKIDVYSYMVGYVLNM